ncbi:MAG: cytochrome P450 [Pseudomonadota bacterium]
MSASPQPFAGPTEPCQLGIDRPTLDRLRAAAETYGPIVRFKSADGRQSVYIEDPDLARDLLVRRHGLTSKGRGFERVKMLLGNGLIVSDGAHWRRSRTMVQPAFKRSAIESMTACMNSHADDMVVAWKEAAHRGSTIDLAEQTTRFGLGVIVDCIFGDDVDGRTAADPDSRFAFLRPDAARDLSMVQAARSLRLWISDVVANRAQETSVAHDFLGLYLEARDKQGERFSERELLDEMITLIVAGFETTANTLAWVWFELARHPEVADQINAELVAHGAAHNPSLEAVSDLPYTLQVLQETLRLYPPVWLYTRRADEAIDLGEYLIEKGEQIYLSPYLTQRSSRYWDEPDQFRPERFAGVGQKAQGASYFPFSLGPRRCVGEHFSYLEMKIQLATVLPHLIPRLPASAATPELEYAINLRSLDPLPIELSIRRSH